MVQKKMNKLVIITGPPAVGKSDRAIEIALKFGGEIVGADSMQIYKKMNIGTGKVTKAEMKGVPHHMIDIVMPDEDYSVGRYVTEARDSIQSIIDRAKLPVLVGGTGLYINSLLFNHSFAGAPKNESIRNKLKEEAAAEGSEKLYSRLLAVDPESALKINKNDTKRIIRALEIYEITGKPRSEFKDDSSAAYDYLLIVLNDDRESLYNRIDARVDKMFALGLVEEVKELYEYKDCNSMQAIGYKEVIEYLDGKISLEEAEENVKIDSRHYAKRQMTFFRGMKAEKLFINVNDDIETEIKRFIDHGE